MLGDGGGHVADGADVDGGDELGEGEEFGGVGYGDGVLAWLDDGAVVGGQDVGDGYYVDLFLL